MIFPVTENKEALGDSTIKIFGGKFYQRSHPIAAYVFRILYSNLVVPRGCSLIIGYKNIFVEGLCCCNVYAALLRYLYCSYLLLFFLYGYSSGYDGWQSMYTYSHDKNTATAVGFYTSCQSICTLLASTIAGFLWDGFGSFYTFIATALIAALVMVYFLLKFRKNWTTDAAGLVSGTKMETGCRG